jgi:hypothetical protein
MDFGYVDDQQSAMPVLFPFAAPMAIHGHSPAQPVLALCFSTGKRGIRTMIVSLPPPAAFGGGRRKR